MTLKMKNMDTRLIQEAISAAASIAVAKIHALGETYSAKDNFFETEFERVVEGVLKVANKDSEEEIQK